MSEFCRNSNNFRGGTTPNPICRQIPSKAMPNRYVQITENKTVKSYDPNIAGLAEKQDGGHECYGKYCVVTRGESSLTFSNPGMMLGRAEKAGSGVDKILSGWNDLGWATPVLTEELQPDYVVLTLPMGKAKPHQENPTRNKRGLKKE